MNLDELVAGCLEMPHMPFHRFRSKLDAGQMSHLTLPPEVPKYSGAYAELVMTTLMISSIECTMIDILALLHPSTFVDVVERYKMKHSSLMPLQEFVLSMLRQLLYSVQQSSLTLGNSRYLLLILAFYRYILRTSTCEADTTARRPFFLRLHYSLAYHPSEASFQALVQRLNDSHDRDDENIQEWLINARRGTPSSQELYPEKLLQCDKSYVKWFFLVRLYGQDALQYFHAGGGLQAQAALFCAQPLAVVDLLLTDCKRYLPVPIDYFITLTASFGPRQPISASVTKAFSADWVGALLAVLQRHPPPEPFSGDDYLLLCDPVTQLEFLFHRLRKMRRENGQKFKSYKAWCCVFLNTMASQLKLEGHRQLESAPSCAEMQAAAEKLGILIAQLYVNFACLCRRKTLPSIHSILLEYLLRDPRYLRLHPDLKPITSKPNFMALPPMLDTLFLKDLHHHMQVRYLLGFKPIVSESVFRRSPVCSPGGYQGARGPMPYPAEASRKKPIGDTDYSLHIDDSDGSTSNDSSDSNSSPKMLL